MAPKHKVTVSVQPTGRQPTSAERRAAQIAALSTHQAKLKQEAADRRQARIDNPLAVPPRDKPVTRRRNAL